MPRYRTVNGKKIQFTAEEEKLLTQLKKSKNFKPNPGKTEKGFFDRVRDFMS